jgi:hypothetical protein
MRLTGSNDHVDGGADLAGAAHVAAWWLQGGRFWYVALRRSAPAHDVSLPGTMRSLGRNGA